MTVRQLNFFRRYAMPIILGMDGMVSKRSLEDTRELGTYRPFCHVELKYLQILRMQLRQAFCHDSFNRKLLYARRITH